MSSLFVAAGRKGLWIDRSGVAIGWLGIGFGVDAWPWEWDLPLFADTLNDCLSDALI